MLKTGQCPNCYAINSFNTRDCLECRVALPWAADVEAQIAANRAAEQARLQAAQQAAAAQAAQLASTRRAAPSGMATGAASTQALSNIPPGQPLPVNAFQVFADGFMGQYSSALENMDKRSATLFGLISAIFYNLCMVAGAYLMFRSFMSSLGGLLGIPTGIPGFPTPTTPTVPSLSAPELFKLLVVGVTPWLTIAVSCTAARKIFGGEEKNLEGDIFIAGVVLVPIGLWILAAGLLGFSNLQVTIGLGVIAVSYSILLLYRGLTTISGIRDSAAAVCVPLVLLLSSFLANLVFRLLLNNPLAMAS